MTSLSPQACTPPRVVDYFGSSLNDGVQLTTSFRSNDDICSTWPRKMKGIQKGPEGVVNERQTPCNSTCKISDQSPNLEEIGQIDKFQSNILHPSLYNSPPRHVSTIPKLFRQHSLDRAMPSHQYPDSTSCCPPPRQFSQSSIIQEGVVLNQSLSPMALPTTTALVCQFRPGSMERKPKAANLASSDCVPVHNEGHHLPSPASDPSENNDDGKILSDMTSGSSTMSSKSTQPGRILQPPPSLSPYSSDSDTTTCDRSQPFSSS